MAISLDSIRTTSDTKPPRILIYSTHGVGKTTFGAHAPSPIFLQTEDGEGSLNLATFGLLKTYTDIIEALDVLILQDHPYKSVIVDSADHLEPLVWQAVCDAHGWESIESPGFGKGYVEADAFWRVLLDRLDILRNQKNMVVIITAHAKIEKFESPEHDAYDHFDIKLHKRANGLLQELVDVILFATHKVHVVTEDSGFNKKRSRGVGTGERIMYTTERPAFTAKNRYSLPHELPLDYPIFEQALLAAREAGPQGVLPEAAPAVAEGPAQDTGEEAAAAS